jgi:hypothetical protein
MREEKIGKPGGQEGVEDRKGAKKEENTKGDRRGKGRRERE